MPAKFSYFTRKLSKQNPTKLKRITTKFLDEKYPYGLVSTLSAILSWISGYHSRDLTIKKFSDLGLKFHERVGSKWMRKCDEKRQISNKHAEIFCLGCLEAGRFGMSSRPIRSQLGSDWLPTYAWKLWIEVAALKMNEIINRFLWGVKMSIPRGKID